MIKHTIISGLLPKEGDDISQALTNASKEGYTVLGTAVCICDDDSVYYAATLGRPVSDPQERPTIKMGERSFMGSSLSVDPKSAGK